MTRKELSLDRTRLAIINRPVFFSFVDSFHHLQIRYLSFSKKEDWISMHVTPSNELGLQSINLETSWLVVTKNRCRCRLKKKLVVYPNQNLFLFLILFFKKMPAQLLREKMDEGSFFFYSFLFLFNTSCASRTLRRIKVNDDEDNFHKKPRQAKKWNKINSLVTGINAEFHDSRQISFSFRSSDTIVFHHFSRVITWCVGFSVEPRVCVSPSVLISIFPLVWRLQRIDNPVLEW